MSVLGIIACQVLELEIAYLIKHSTKIERVTILEDKTAHKIIHALESSGDESLYRIPHINSFSRLDTNHIEILIQIHDISLHRNKNLLRRTLRKTAQDISKEVDAIFFAYGLCGSALESPQELLDIPVPVFIPMDGSRPIDDCVGMLMGGHENYYQEQKKIPGTYFMTPGWLNHWHKVFGTNITNVTRKEAKKVFKHYKRSLLILTPVVSEHCMRKKVVLFNTLTDSQSETYNGSMLLLNNTWKNALNYLMTIE